MREFEINSIIRNVALQAVCFECVMQRPYVDTDGVIRCRNHDKCHKVIHYSRAAYQYPDPDFDEITYARCSNCGQMLYKPGEMTKCPLCGYEVIWEKGEPI